MKISCQWHLALKCQNKLGFPAKFVNKISAFYNLNSLQEQPRQFLKLLIKHLDSFTQGRWDRLVLLVLLVVNAT